MDKKAVDVRLVLDIRRVVSVSDDIPSVNIGPTILTTIEDDLRKLLTVKDDYVVIAEAGIIKVADFVATPPTTIQAQKVNLAGLEAYCRACGGTVSVYINFRSKPMLVEYDPDYGFLAYTVDGNERAYNPDDCAQARSALLDALLQPLR